MESDIDEYRYCLEMLFETATEGGRLATQKAMLQDLLDCIERIESELGSIEMQPMNILTVATA